MRQNDKKTFCSLKVGWGHSFMSKLKYFFLLYVHKWLQKPGFYDAQLDFFFDTAASPY